MKSHAITVSFLTLTVVFTAGLVSAVPLNFAVPSYPFSDTDGNGFSDRYLKKVSGTDNDQSLLCDVDLPLTLPVIDGSSETISLLFSINLDNSDAVPNYIPGSSKTGHSFLNDSSSATNFTLHRPGTHLGVLIEDGTTFSETYFDSIVPVPTPEPGTMLLLASGLLGLFGLERRKRRQKVL